MSSPPASCLASITSALMTTPASPGGDGEAAAASLREGLLQNRQSSSRRVAIEQLRERADALRREVDAAKEGAEAAAEATRRAGERERGAAAELDATARASKMQGAKLRELEDEMRYKEGRIKVLEAIAATVTSRKKRSVHAK